MLSLYTAPLEGVTGHIFRHVHQAHFGGADKYFLPFIAPHGDGKIKNRERRDCDPALNSGITAVPQILTNAPEVFVMTARYLANLGYREINLNLGCPSPTVVTKHKGAGLLEDPAALDRFLAGIFDALRDEVSVSVKTRIGLHDPAEAAALFTVFDKYPIAELIVHPRTRDELYRGLPHREIFESYAAGSRCPLVYNGGLYTVSDIAAFEEAARLRAGRQGAVAAVMCGRGLLRNPALFRAYRDGADLTPDALSAFHDALYEAYSAELSGPAAVLGHMKELWIYWETLLTADCRKARKGIRKAKRTADYEAAVREIFRNGEWLPAGAPPRQTDKLVLT